MRILEIGDAPYVSSYLPNHSDYYRTSKKEESAPLGLKEIFRLHRKLRRGDYALVVYHLTEKVLAPWHRSRPVWRNIYDTVARTFSRSKRNNWHYFHFFLRDLSTPLVVIDTQDAPRISRTEAAWLDRSLCWFMRELPVNHWALFLNMDLRSGDVINIQRQPGIRRNLSKIRPFSLGFTPQRSEALPELSPEKIHDVFYTGANHTTTVRSGGLAELRALQAQGLRIYLPERRLSREEFLRACAESWLVWSPEGQGWDCHRHYEALQMNAVPLINYPTIHRWQPLIDGEHCLFYPPEPGGLSAAIRAALREPEKLRLIAAQGKEHILRHHRHSQLARHVLDVAGLLAEFAPYWVEP